MKYELSQRFYFEAAHTLHRDIDAEGSKRVHGHTYHAEVMIIGEPDVKTGMITDLGLLRREIERVRALLDHRLLDEISDLGAPTLENLCLYISKTMFGVSNLAAVTVERQASGDRCVLRLTAG